MRRSHFIKRTLSAIIILAVFMLILRVTRNNNASPSAAFHEQITHKDLMQVVDEVVPPAVHADHGAVPPQAPQAKQGAQQGAPQQGADHGVHAANGEHAANGAPGANGAPAAQEEKEELSEEEKDQQLIMEGMKAYELIANQPDVPPVIIFSKSYCPHSMRAKAILLDEYQITPEPLVIELDQIEHGAAVQRYLHQITGRRTVPNILVNGESRGGASDIAELGSSLIPSFLDWSDNKITIREREN